MGNGDPKIQEEIITWLRDKQDANERRMLYMAKLAAEKEGGLPKLPKYRKKDPLSKLRLTQWAGIVKQKKN